MTPTKEQVQDWILTIQNSLANNPELTENDVKVHVKLNIPPEKTNPVFQQLTAQVDQVMNATIDLEEDDPALEEAMKNKFENLKVLNTQIDALWTDDKASYTLTELLELQKTLK